MADNPQNPPAVPAAPVVNDPPAPPNPIEKVMLWLRVGVSVLVLVVAVLVVFTPNFNPAPAPRIILFLLVALLPALLVGADATTRFKLELPGFLFTTGGALGAVAGLLVLVNHLAKPEEQIAVFHIVDEQDNDLKLGWKGAVEVETTRKGYTVTHFVEGNTLVLIFPEQAPTVTLKVRKSFDGRVYRGDVTYVGSRSAPLKCGKDLIAAAQ